MGLDRSRPDPMEPIVQPIVTTKTGQTAKVNYGHDMSGHVRTFRSSQPIPCSRCPLSSSFSCSWHGFTKQSKHIGEI